MKLGPEKQKQHKKKNGNRDSDDRLRDPPEMLAEFKDNLEDTETPVAYESGAKIHGAQF